MFAGNVLSFIYTDFAASSAFLYRDLREEGFRGYRPIVKREFSWTDIVPTDWSPLLIDPDFVDCALRNNDSPFVHWSVWERYSSNNPEPGPKTFSLLYLSEEMSIVYQALYCRMSIVPKILTIKGRRSCGDLHYQDSIFKRVLKANNAGMPEYLYGDHTGSLRIEYSRGSVFGERGPQMRRHDEFNCVNTSILCPTCGDPMIVKNGFRGRFYGCSGFLRFGCRGTRDYIANAYRGNFE